MLIFETFWNVHTLNLAGSIFSLVCFLAFLSYGGLRKCLFVYKDHGEHEPIQRVLHWCLFALGGTIVLLLSGYPNVPRFLLMATGDILKTQTHDFFWGDAGLYFFYWLSLDWIHFGIVFTLSSATKGHRETIPGWCWVRLPLSRIGYDRVLLQLLFVG